MASIRLRLTPGAREDTIEGWRDGVLRVRVRARPEKGRANEALVRLLAERLGLARSGVALVRGHTSRDKVVEVEGMSEEELRGRLGGPGEQLSL
jgi:uncharacterized protein (TIGR00251 family)